MRRTMLAAATLAGAVLASPALALYRCGNSFQDKPCESGEQRPMRATAPASTSPQPQPQPVTARSTPSIHAPACSRIGEHAEKISWKREGGATLEQQLAELPPSADPAEMSAVVRWVYARRGSANAIRKEIEVECIRRKEAADAAAETLNALRRQAGQSAVDAPASPPAPPLPASSTATPAAARPVAATRNGEACSALKGERDRIESRLRQGGSAATMESLQNRRRDVERRMSETRC